MNDVESPTGRQLVSAAELLTILWPESSRPSLRWLREMQRQRRVPFFKVARKVYFDPALVMRSLEAQNLVETRVR